MESYCGTPFLDLNQTWRTFDPDFSGCFQKTLLVWIPCGFLWLLAPLEIYWVVRSKEERIPWSWLSYLRMTLLSIMVSVVITDFFLAILRHLEGRQPTSADFYNPMFKEMTLVLVGVLLVAEKLRGICTSGIIFCFWLLLWICETIMFRSLVKRAFYSDEDDRKLPVYMVATSIIFYIANCIQLILFCFADVSKLVRFTHKVQKLHPEETASFLSLLTFSWFDRMVWTGFRRPLVENDLWKMRESYKSAQVCEKFEAQWTKREYEQRCSPSKLPKPTLQLGHGDKPVKNGTVSKQEYEPLMDTADVPLSKVLRSEFGPTVFTIVLLKVIGCVVAFAAPLLLQCLIEFVISDEPQWHGFLYAATLFTCAFVASVFINQGTAIIMRMSLQLRSALISAIYKKALTISTSARRATAVGEIVNLMAVDTERIAEMILEIPVVFTAPLQIALAIYLLWRLLGVAVLAGLSMLLLVLPFNILIGVRMEKYHTMLMGCKDKRVKMMNEVLNGIKILKLYAWEKSFHSQISGIRKQELSVVKKNVMLMAAITFTYVVCPFLIALAMFTTYILMDSSHVLDAGKAFTAISLIAIIKEPMLMGPAILGIMVQMRVCIDRISKFLNSKNIDESQVSHIDYDDDNVINVQNADFTWDLELPPTLKSINFKIQRGSLIAVVGPVGTGKSSLVSALLGEMEILNGTVNTLGTVAYVPQQAWIKNATLKDNILFSKPYDDRRYKRILETCALKPDLAILPAGDKTEIGEKGINLSGGQKQRVSLARAAYSNADLYFLDDPLSALDSHVGRHIFDKVIGPKGILKNKSRILVTHGLAFLPEVDAVIVLQDGNIAETGTYAELMKRGEAFAEFVKSYQHQDSDEELEDDDFNVDDQIRTTSTSFKKRATLRQNVTSALSVSSEEGSVRGKIRVTLNRKSLIVADEKEADGKLIEAESVETAKVSWDVYRYYVSSVGYVRFAIFTLMYMSATAMGTSTNYWLSRWSTDPPGDTRRRDIRLGIYALFGMSEAVISFFGFVVSGCFLLRAAGILHDDMLLNILKSPMSFFDTTPLGRILNRFSRDIETVDNTLLMNVLWCMNMLCELIGILVMISIGTPIMVVVIIPLALVYFATQKLYISSSRQLKRLESVTRSPIYSHFSETLSGISTIRAFQLQNVFVKDSFDKVDINQSSMYPNFAAKCWLALRLDFMGSIIVLCTSLFAVVQREEIDPGTLGLAVAYSLTVTFALNWTAKIMGDLETQIVSVERIKEYNETPTEAVWEIPNTKPNADWPKDGFITFEKYSTRYREGLDLVIKGLQCSIKGGERIGIVGRTGAGKSSLTLALFRLIEAANGRILMDGIDIGKLGLHDLRSRLTIIPQDPVLFCGSLRLNLDPFGAYSDTDVWNALEHAHLKEFVSTLTEGLEYQIAEGGENLSVGQRQLVCLARALLRKTKVLILDEATAAVDLKTDDLIQTTIRKEFADCTVLTIAHRLNTILDSSRILVLQNGVIKEFDTPENLLNDFKSEFYSMAKDAGLV